MQRFIRRNDDGNIIELYYETVLNEFDTNASGEKVYDKVLFVKKIPPGGGNQEAVHELKRVFGNKNRPNRVNREKLDPISHLVAEFESGHSSALDGTPIEDVSFIHPSMVGLLKVRNIHTVEILAEIPDSALGVIGMEGREYRDKAKYYLQAQKEKAPLEALANLTKRFEDLEKQLTNEGEDNDEVMIPKKRGRQPVEKSA